MTVSKRVLGSDLDQVDAHQITEAEYAEVPELDDAWFAKARKRGPARTKEAVSIRLDQDLVARLRASGAGWQSRVNEVLRDWAEKNLAAS